MIPMFDDVNGDYGDDDGSYDDNGDVDGDSNNDYRCDDNDDHDDDEACSLQIGTCFVVAIRVFVIAVREVSTYSMIWWYDGMIWWH